MTSKSWDFGTAQAKVKIENDQLTWSLIGNGTGSYPMRSVNGIQYETAGMFSIMGHFVILASGGDNKRVQIPKSKKSEQLVQEINEIIRQYHQSEPKASTSPPINSILVADELMKLAGLRDAGVLTEAEFLAQKKKLLSDQ